MYRFFADSQNINRSGGSIKLNIEDTEHIRVLRLRPDEHFIVCDGHGIDYTCRLGEHDDTSIAEIISQDRSQGEPTVKCSVFSAYQKGERLDYLIQKSVELGVYEIVLFESERCIAVPRDIQKKLTRLRRIALETAKLSGRGRVPAVTSAGRFKDAIKIAASSFSLPLFFYESEDNLHIKDVLENHFLPAVNDNETDQNTISIITGPEGGFEPHEVDSARMEGFKIVSLGPRILRSETAPAAALAAIMYQTDNF